MKAQLLFGLGVVFALVTIVYLIIKRLCDPEKFYKDEMEYLEKNDLL